MNRAAERLAPIGLAELQERAALLERVERKYIATQDQAEAMFERIGDRFRALEIDGMREFRYRTTYYDTPELAMLRAHLQRRRRRFKCRRRLYVDSSLAMLEVKFKGVRGVSLKEAMASGPGLSLLDEDIRFFRETVQRAYGRELPFERLAPTLTVDVRRITLAAPALGERVTFDTAVSLPGWRLASGLVIVESKSHTGRATADSVLRSLGVRPLPCSKYCVGMALDGAQVRANAYRPVMRRFVPAA